MATEIQAPEPWARGKFTLFLAGVIDQGAAEDWQSRIAEALADYDVLILNPRRDDWDSSWEQSAEDPRFREQVVWEQAALADADYRTFVLLEDSKGPITLQEMGEFAGKPGVVCCEEGYERQGNVDIVAVLKGMPIVRSVDALIEHLTEMLDAKGLRTGEKTAKLLRPKIAEPKYQREVVDEMLKKAPEYPPLTPQQRAVMLDMMREKRKASARLLHKASASGVNWAHPAATTLRLEDLDAEYPDYTVLIFQFVEDGGMYTGLPGGEEVAWDRPVAVKLMATAPALKQVKRWGMAGDDGDDRGEPTIARLMEEMQRGVFLPPAVTDHKGDIIDGRHRIHAASRLGIKHIPYINVLDCVADASNAKGARKQASRIGPVYHGTRKKFEQFETKYQLYFTDSKELAEKYAEPDGTVHTVFLLLQKPLKVDAKGNDWDSVPFTRTLSALCKETGFNFSGYDDHTIDADTLGSLAKHAGYDGVIIRNIEDGKSNAEGPTTEFIVFSTAQIEQSREGFDTEATSAKEAAKANSAPGSTPAKSESSEAPTSVKVPVTDTPEFKSWFAGSKIVDAKRAPLMVYHGSSENFTEFQGGRSIHFTDQESNAAGYAQGYQGTASGHIYSAYIFIENPIDLRKPGESEHVFEETEIWIDHDTILDPEALGEIDWSDTPYDGIIAHHESGGGARDGAIEFIVFDPGQVWIVNNEARIGRKRAATMDAGRAFGALPWEVRNEAVRLLQTTPGDHLETIVRMLVDKPSVPEDEAREIAAYAIGTYQPSEYPEPTPPTRFSKSKGVSPVYHGSPHEFEKFDLGEIGKESGNRGFLGAGFYFSADKSVASAYGKVTEYRLRVSKPLIVNEPLSAEAAALFNKVTQSNFFEAGKTRSSDLHRALSDTVSDFPEVADDLSEAIEAAGYDSLFYNDMQEIVVYSPEVIERLPAAKQAAASSPEQEAFLSALDGITSRNPFNPRERVWEDLVIFEVYPFDGRIHLSSIRSVEPGQGNASRALNVLLRLADKTGVEIDADAVPFGSKDLSKSKLTAWYKRHGFVSRDNSLVYKAKGKKLQLGPGMRTVPIGDSKTGASSRLQCSPMSADWKARLEEKCGHDLASRQDLKALFDRLVSLGGEYALLESDENPPDEVARLLARGEFRTGQARLRKMKSNSCHWNAAEMMHEGMGTVVTGYALSADGLWRQHSWLVTPKNTLIETTVKRVAYYGVPLTWEEVKREFGIKWTTAPKPTATPAEQRTAASAPQITETPAFKAWFRNSLVKDAQGNPLVVYRGEHGDSGEEFHSRLPSLSFGDADTASSYAMGDLGHNSGSHSPRVYPCYLRIERPIVTNTDDPWTDLADIEKALGREAAIHFAIENAGEIEETNNWDENFSSDYTSVKELLAEKPEAVRELFAFTSHLLNDPEFVAAAKAKGYDGGIHSDSGNNDTTEYRIFDPSQAKSALGNNGNFDPENHSVTAAAGIRGQIEAVMADMMADVDRAFDTGEIDQTGNPWGNCTTGAEHIIDLVGRGDIFGYTKADNPTAELADGDGEGGHDFAIIDNLLVDFWASDYKGTPGIIPLSNRALITELYGDPQRWEKRTGSGSSYSRLPHGEGLPPQLMAQDGPNRSVTAATTCTCGHSWDEHYHLADFGCKHEGEGCGCLGWTDKQPKKATLGQEELVRHAEAYEDQWDGEASGYPNNGHPAYIRARDLVWKVEPHFDLHRIKGFDSEPETWKWLVRDLWDRLRENEETPGDAKNYYDALKTAIEAQTVDPILVVEGRDGQFYLWDGNHRVALAKFMGKTVFTAWVGYQPTGDVSSVSTDAATQPLEEAEKFGDQESKAASSGD